MAPYHVLWPSILSFTVAMRKLIKGAPPFMKYQINDQIGEGTTRLTPARALPSLLHPCDGRRCACLGISDVYFVGGGGTAAEDRNDNGRAGRGKEGGRRNPEMPSCLMRNQGCYCAVSLRENRFLFHFCYPVKLTALTERDNQ